MTQRYQTVKNTSTKRLVIVDLVSDLPETALTSTLYFVRDGRRLYVYSDNGPIPIVTENDIPSWVDLPGSTNVVLLDNVFVQRLEYDDPEQIIGTFSFSVTQGSVNASNSIDLIDGEVFAVDSNVPANFTIRFSASDGANEITALSEFILRQEEYVEADSFRLANEATPNSNLGTSVAINGNFSFFGAPGIQEVVVHKKNAFNNAVFHQTLSPSVDSPGFGTSIASAGNYLVIGAPTAVNNNGQVWLFTYVEETDQWIELDYISILSNGQSGTSVDIYNDFVVVGGPNSNRVDCYNVSNGAFGTSFPLTVSNITGVTGSDKFGQSVAIDVRPSGTLYIAVGAPGDESNTGSAFNIKLSYIAENNPQFALLDQTKILGQYSTTGDEFGFSVDILEYELAVGAPNNDLNNLNGGIVYVYKENPLNNDWNETDVLLTSSANSNALFGSSLKFNRDILYPGGSYLKSIIVGAQLDGGAGRVYNFKFDSENDRYVEHRQILTSDGSSSDFVGKSVAVQDNEILIGAPGKESATGLVSNVGIVYEFRLEKAENVAEFANSPFTAYLKQGTTETYDIAVTHPDGLELTLFIYSVANIDAERVSITDGVLSVDMPSDNVDNVTVTIGAEDQYGRIALQENTFIPTNTDNIQITSGDLFNIEEGEYTVTVTNPSTEIYSVSAVPMTNLSENQIGVSNNTIIINDLLQDASTPIAFRAIVETGANGYIDYLDISRTYTWTVNIDQLTSDNVSFAVSNTGVDPDGIYFKNDGTKMFIYQMQNATVYQYSLSTAWDITTATSEDSFSTGQLILPSQFTMSHDGLKFYVSDNNTGYLYQYAMSTAWDVSNVVYEGQWSHRDQDTAPYGMVFNDTGTKLLVLGRDTDSVYEYTVTTPWDITGTVIYQSNSLYVNPQDASPAGIFCDDKGTKLYYTGISTDQIYQYDLITPFDLSTAVYSGKSFSVGPGNPYGLYIKQDDGTKLYILVANTVYQYSTGL